MEGLLGQVMGGRKPPQEAPQQPQGDDMLQGMDQEPMELEQATDEEQQIFDQVVAECVKAVTGEKVIRRILERMAKRDPAQVVAEEAVRTVKTFDDAMGGSIPRDIVVNCCVEVAANLHEIAIKAEIMQNDEATAQKFLGMTVALAEKEFGLSEGEEPEAPDGE